MCDVPVGSLARQGVRIRAGVRRLEREHRTSIVALDEIAQQTGGRPVYQKRGNIFFLGETKQVLAGAGDAARGNYVFRHTHAFFICTGGRR